ncbi:MAG: DUF2236 domain-containing protein [Ferruginibacter sp.]|nr:DUF2236 domain-containing protein [Cytophagales bacterium]
MLTVKTTRVFSDSMMQSRRQEADLLADEVIGEVFRERGMPGLGQLMAFLGKRKSPAAQETASFNLWSGQSSAQRLRATIAQAELTLGEQPGPELPAPVHAYFAAEAQLPGWADRARMAEGAVFFEKNLDQLLLLLGCYSLPYCYAAADGAQVLFLSQRIHQDTYQRLLETGQFVLEVTKPDAFSEKGLGVVTSRKIRLMHAAIRFFTRHSGRWNDAWGVPINQEDMAGTHLAMSYIPIRGLRKVNANPGERESEAYLHLWNVIGYFLGIAEDLLPANLREAYHLDRLIAKRNFRPSEAGRTLTKALLDSLAANTPAALPKNLPANQMRLLLGDELADLLALPAADWTRGLVQTTQIGNLFRV